MKSNLQTYLLVAIPFLCFIIGYSLCNMFIGNKSYPTPNLIGITLHEAILQTSPYHLHIQLAAQKECPGIAHGSIISQKPAPGRLIKSHQSIVVVTCKLPEAQLAPNLQGLTQVQAQELCAEQRIKLKSCPIAYPLPTGTCIGQTPQKGQELSDKKIIMYEADSEPSTYLMPNLIGKSVQDVVEFLKKHDAQINLFFQNQKMTAPYPDFMKIIAQKPLPGSFVNLAKNMMVQLEIGK